MAISVGDAVLNVGINENDLNKGLDKVTGKINSSTAKWSKGMKIAGGIMVASVVAVATVSIKTASEFDTAMREVNTMMGLSKDEFQAFSKEVKGLSKDMGVDAVKSAKALYQAISAGVPKENAIDFLRIATKAAIGGVTETEVAVDGLTTVINAFKLPITDAEKVADIMFTTVKGGKTTFEELSASLFQVAPIAAASGVKFEEVSAALATMTKQGVPTSVATTQLRQAMVALQKPTADMQIVIGDLGYESGQSMLQELGLAGTLNTLKDSTGGSNEMLMKMFGSVEGGSAVLALTGENAQMFTTDFEAMSDTAGASNDAFVEMEGGIGHTMEKMKSQFKDMSLSIGNALIPILEKLMKFVAPIIEKVSTWIEENPVLVDTILAIVGAVGSLLLMGEVLLPMLGTIKLAFSAIISPTGLVILAIGALIVAIVLIVKNWDLIKEKTINIWNNLLGFFKGIPGKIGTIFGTVKDIILSPFRAALSGIESGINWLIKQMNKISFKVPDWVPFIGGKTFGINIPEIKLPGFAEGGMITEPTLLYGLKSQKPYAIAGEKGPEMVGPQNTQTDPQVVRLLQATLREMKKMNENIPQSSRDIGRIINGMA